MNLRKKCLDASMRLNNPSQADLAAACVLLVDAARLAGLAEDLANNARIALPGTPYSSTLKALKEFLQHHNS